MGVNPPQKITGAVLFKKKCVPVQGTGKGLIHLIDLILNGKRKKKKSFKKNLSWYFILKLLKKKHPSEKRQN